MKARVGRQKVRMALESLVPSIQSFQSLELSSSFKEDLPICLYNNSSAHPFPEAPKPASHLQSKNTI
jgi:hypothetical protein